jgi:hypothetical protein
MTVQRFGTSSAPCPNGVYVRHSDYAALEAEVQALREDAERYRWLRAQRWDKSNLAVVCHPKQSARLGFDCPSAERLDSAIDAARGSN